MNEDYMYGILCESELGLDAFGNPIGKPILLEFVGEQMRHDQAVARFEKFKSSGQFGDVKLVKLQIVQVGYEARNV